MWMFIWSFILAIIGPLIPVLFRGLGFSFVTYLGMDLLLDTVEDRVFTELGGLSADVVSILKLAGVDQSLNVIFSAIALKFALAGWNNGSKQTGVWRKPGQLGRDGFEA